MMTPAISKQRDLAMRLSEDSAVWLAVQQAVLGTNPPTHVCQSIGAIHRGYRIVALRACEELYRLLPGTTVRDKRAYACSISAIDSWFRMDMMQVCNDHERSLHDDKY
jgi:hypothetical protein